MDLREYLWSLTMVCVAAAVVRAVSAGKWEKHVEMICSLCVICAALLPVAGQLPELSADGMESFFDDVMFEYGAQSYGEIYGAYLLEESVGAAEDTLQVLLSTEFSVDVEDIEVFFITEQTEEGHTVKEAVVTLYSGAVATDPQLIVDYVKTSVGCECRIIYELVGE